MIEKRLKYSHRTVSYSNTTVRKTKYHYFDNRTEKNVIRLVL